MTLRTLLLHALFTVCLLVGKASDDDTIISDEMRETMKEKQHQWEELSQNGTASERTGAAQCINGKANGYACRNVDLLDFLPLQELGGGKHMNDVWGWASNGREFALVGSTEGTVFVDVTSPTNSFAIGILPATNGAFSHWRDIKVYQDHAYISSESSWHGVQVFDLKVLLGMQRPNAGELPRVPLVTTYKEVGSAHNLVVNEESGFLYVVGSHQDRRACRGGLHAIDVRDPANPKFAGCFSSDGYTHDAQCVMYRGPDAAYRGKEVCFCFNEDTLTVVDVTDKRSMKTISRTDYKSRAYAHQGWLTTDHAMLLMDDELDEIRNKFPDKRTRTLIWNVGDLDRPAHVGYYVSPEVAIDHNLYTDAHYAWESNYCAGMRVLGLEKVKSAVLQEVAFFDAEPSACGLEFKGTWSVYTYFPSGVIVANSINRGLFVLQANLPNRPKPISFGTGTTTTGTTTTSTTKTETTTSATTLPGLSIRETGGDGCLKSQGGRRLLQQSATSGCAKFTVSGKVFRSMDVPGQCLDYFESRGWGLWTCHGGVNQQLEHRGSKWCFHEKCVELSTAPTSTTAVPLTTTVILTTTVPPTTITTTVTSTSSTSVSMGIQSGDTVFLMTRSGSSNHIDVEDASVQARWKSHGNWQAIILEKQTGGTVNAGDTVYLRTHTNAHIHVREQSVEAKWSDYGHWQAMTIEKQGGASGPILPNSLVCFKAHTGKHLDVEDGVVRARWEDCGNWQSMLIQKEVTGALFSGNSIHLLAHTGKHLDVQSDAMQARWTDRNAWQTFSIANYGGRVISSGDVVFLEAHTGAIVDVEGEAVKAHWKEFGAWQQLVIIRKEGSGAVMPGDTCFFRAHTGKMLDVQGDAVRARYAELGTWQEFVVEKSVVQNSGPRRLQEAAADESQKEPGFGSTGSMVLV